MNKHTCRVCGYSDDPEFEPRDYQICGCCGTEFGYDDRVLTHKQLRLEWIRNGYRWFDPHEPRPINWSPIAQLTKAGMGAELLDVFSQRRDVASPKPTVIALSRPGGTSVPYRIAANTGM